MKIDCINLKSALVNQRGVLAKPNDKQPKVNPKFKSIWRINEELH